MQLVDSANIESRTEQRFHPQSNSLPTEPLGSCINSYCLKSVHVPLASLQFIYKHDFFKCGIKINVFKYGIYRSN